MLILNEGGNIEIFDNKKLNSPPTLLFALRITIVRGAGNPLSILKQTKRVNFHL